MNSSNLTIEASSSKFRDTFKKSKSLATSMYCEDFNPIADRSASPMPTNPQDDARYSELKNFEMFCEAVLRLAIPFTNWHLSARACQLWLAIHPQDPAIVAQRPSRFATIADIHAVADQSMLDRLISIGRVIVIAKSRCSDLSATTKNPATTNSCTLERLRLKLSLERSTAIC